MKYATILFCVLAFLLGLPASAYDLHNKALTPIVEQRTPVGAPVTFVKDGACQFVVVVRRDKAYVRSSICHARSLLAEAFGKMKVTNLKFVFPEDKAAWQSAQAVLLLGDSPLARKLGVDYHTLPDQGFVIKTFPKTGDIPPGLMIVGNDTDIDGTWTAGPINARTNSKATLFGVIDFLERFMGVRWYFNGALGEIHPVCRNLRIAPVHYEDAPYFNTRGNPYGFYCTSLQKPDGKEWKEILGPECGEPRINDRWRLGLTEELLGKHNPDPFSVANAFPDKIDKIFYRKPTGELMQSTQNYFVNYFDPFNLGKDGWAETLIDCWKRFYESNGKDVSGGVCSLMGQRYINYGVTDVYLNPVDYLSHPLVLSEKLVQQSDFERGDNRTYMSNVYGRFFNHLGKRLKEELPGKRLFVMCYYNCKYAPTRFQLPDNVDVMVCDGGLLCFAHDPAAQAKSVELFKGWYDALGGRPPLMAYLYGGGGIATGIVCEYIGEVVRVLGKYLGRTGVFYDGNHSWFHYWGYYAGAHQQWNPDFDAVASFDEMALLMFGEKAAPHVSDFHNRARAAVEKYVMPTLLNPKTPKCPAEEIDGMEQALAKARAAIEPDSVEMRRFEVFAHDWPGILSGLRKSLEASTKKNNNGLYNVERRKGTRQDWTNIPVVPGTEGLKLVWNEKGLYGRADGPIDFKLKSYGKNAKEQTLAYDTMVPSFTLPFGSSFSGKVYKAIDMKPFGRLRLLGEGDSAVKKPAKPIIDMSGDVRITADNGSLLLVGPHATYNFGFGRMGGRDDTIWTMRCNILNNPLFHNWSFVFGLEVNGISFAEVDLGMQNAAVWQEDDKKGVEYALNFNGTSVKLRLFMKATSELLWGEIVQDPKANRHFPVKSAKLTLGAIPSYLTDYKENILYKMKREVRTATRLVEKPGPLTADDRFYILQDGNYNGTDETRGVGPVYMLVDWREVQKGSTDGLGDTRQLSIHFDLKPDFERTRFGIWGHFVRRQSNEEVYRNLMGQGGKGRKK